MRQGRSLAKERQQVLAGKKPLLCREWGPINGESVTNRSDDGSKLGFLSHEKKTQHKLCVRALKKVQG